MSFHQEKHGSEATVPISERVSKGAQLLDKKKPDWAENINVAVLDMGQSCNCILGQLCGTYFDGKKCLDINFLEVVELGFDITDEEALENMNKSYENLEYAWHKEIESRISKGEKLP